MSQPTDFTDVKTIDERYQQAVRRGDKKWISVHRIKPKFDPDFNVFAAHTAHELRAYLYYRTDNGKNARGLVRASGDLAIIHKLLATAKPPTPTGKPVPLNAILERRQDPLAHMRWTMAIRFNDSTSVQFVDQDPIVKQVDVASVREKMMALYLGHAQVVASRMAGPRGERIRKILTIADRVGYPRNWDLWIYSSAAIWDFMHWRIQLADEETNPNSPRRKMTAATGGRMPFDGNTSAPGYIDWRIYPIRNLVLECAKKPSIDDCDASMHNVLKHTEEEIERGFDAVNKRAKEVTSMPHSPLKPLDVPEKNLGPMAFRFFQHLVAQTKNKDSLYSIWL